MEKKSSWICRWNCWIADKPTKPGVFRRKEGGYLARGRAKDPKTGKLREVKLTLPNADANAAYRALTTELEAIRQGTRQLAAIPHFSDFAVSLLERKIRTAEIRSIKGREKWGDILEHHLLPAFGDYFVDQLRRSDIEDWRQRMALLVRNGQYSPCTVNDWLAVLRVIMNTAVGEFELDRNPMTGVRNLDTSEHHTYTEEEPNSLTLDEVPVFLSLMRRHFPQHFAMTALGFATGWRPSSLRPLRRAGAQCDVLWEAGVLLIRRSHCRKQEVMETTKTKRHQRVPLPPELMDILRWHVSELPEGPMRDSELLFPSETGGYRSSSCLDKPFRKVTELMGLTKHLSPRAMRRTFQDLARAAEVKDVVTRAISGHATEQMQHHYSTVHSAEIASGLARVISLAGVRDAMTASAANAPGGVHGGVHEP